MSYFKTREDVEFIETKERTIEERLLLLEKKVDIIIRKLNNKK